MSGKVANWLTGFVVGWLTSSLGKWLTGLVVGWLTESLGKWLTGLVVGWLTSSLGKWLTGLVVKWPTESLGKWPTGILVGWLTMCGKAVNCKFSRSTSERNLTMQLVSPSFVLRSALRQNVRSGPHFYLENPS
jgi:hypothetical protein